MPETWIDLVEAADGQEDARRAMGHQLTGQDGQAFFERVRSLLGQDQRRARRLASHWRLLTASSATRSWGYRTKGVLERIDGHWLRSVDSFQSAARHAKQPVEKLVFQIGAVDGLGRAGRVKEAVALADRIARKLVAAGLRDEAGQAHLNAANALLWHDEYIKAKARFHKALEHLDSTASASMCAAAKLGLSTTELFGGDPRRADVLAREAEAELERLDLKDFAAIAKTNCAQAALLLGRLDEALETLLELRPKLPPGSFEFGRLEEFLGDVYCRMNRWHEAMDAYEAALATSGHQSSLLNQANAFLGLGIALKAVGKTREAEDRLSRAAAMYRRFGNRAWAAAVDTELGRAARESGNLRQSQRILTKCVETLGKHRSSPLLVDAHLELAETLGSLGKDPRPNVDSASRIARRCHNVHATWRVHYLRAKVPGGKNRRFHYRRMAAEIWQSRALTDSSFSRVSYFADKALALSEYVGFLLSQPTPKRVEEALDVVRQSRSVALLEEILSSNPSSDPELRVRLVALREELNAVIGGEATFGPSRRDLASGAKLGSLQRQWTELNHRVRLEATVRATSSEWPDLLLVEGPKLYAVRGTKSVSLPWSPGELHEKLKWLRFELLAPMTDPTSHADRSLALLREFDLGMWQSPSMRKSPSVTVCPEGHFWQVPWQVLAALDGEQEAVLSVGAWSGRAEHTLPRKPKAMIWHFATTGLPHIEREAQMFQEHFPDAVSCSTIEQVRESLEYGEFDLLHVAAHARFHSTNPIFSSLTFDGGRLTAAEIARSALRVRHVVLSACETGAVSLQNRTEPEGLVRAFLARGAASVLASSWVLDDETAYSYMYTYYNSLTSGETVVTSAHAARSAVRRISPHPYFWGPFALFGGYTS